MKRYKLEEICSLITDGTHQTPVYCDEGGYIFLSSKDVTTRKIDWENTKFVPEELHQKLYKRLQPQLDDILLAKNGTTGVAAIVDRDIVFDIYVSLALLRPIDVVYPKYLLYFINSPFAKRQFNKGLKGIGVPNLHLSTIRKTEINLPNIGKQKEISKLFDLLTEIIDKRQQQLCGLDTLIKSRFVEMFGDPYENSKQWNKFPMGNYMTVLTDFSSNGSYKHLDSNVVMYDEPDYALMVRTTDLEKNDFVTDVKYIDEKAYNILSKSKVFGNEIIMNKIGSAGRVYLMPRLNRPVSLGRNAFLFRFNDEINVTFLYYLLISNYGNKEIMQNVRGAVTKTITKDAARSISIIVPPVQIQNKFELFVHQVDKLKFEVQKSLDETQLLFDSLMQEYFG